MCLLGGLPTDHVWLQAVDGGSVAAVVDADAPFNVTCATDEFAPSLGAPLQEVRRLQAASSRVEVSITPESAAASTDEAACVIVGQLRALNGSDATLSATFARLTSAAMSSGASTAPLSFRVLSVSASTADARVLVCGDEPAAPPQPAAQGVVQAATSASHSGSLGGGLVAGAAAICAFVYVFRRRLVAQRAHSAAKSGVADAGCDNPLVAQQPVITLLTVSDDDGHDHDEPSAAVDAPPHARALSLLSLASVSSRRHASTLAADDGDRVMTPPMLRTRAGRGDDGSHAASSGLSPSAPQPLGSMVWSSSRSAGRRVSAPRPEPPVPTSTPAADAPPVAAADFEQSNPMLSAVHTRKRRSTAPTVALDFDLASSGSSEAGTVSVAQNPMSR